jgi:hypothetical protein
MKQICEKKVIQESVHALTWLIKLLISKLLMAVYDDSH